MKTKKITSAAALLFLTLNIFCQQLIDPTSFEATKEAHQTFMTFNQEEAQKRGGIWKVPKEVLLIVMSVQSGAGKKSGHNYGNVLSHRSLRKYSKFAKREGKYVLCSKRSRGVEVLALALRTMKDNENKSFTNNEAWLQWLFSKGGILESKAAQAEIAYQVLTKKTIQLTSIPKEVIVTKPEVKPTPPTKPKEEIVIVEKPKPTIPTPPKKEEIVIQEPSNNSSNIPPTILTTEDKEPKPSDSQPSTPKEEKPTLPFEDNLVEKEPVQNQPTESTTIPPTEPSKEPKISKPNETPPPSTPLAQSKEPAVAFKPVAVQKKKGKNLVKFSGQGRIIFQQATRQGTGSEVPDMFLRGELFPTVTFGNIPIGLNLLYSTEERSYRQNINQVSLNFDARQFQQNMKRSLDRKLQEKLRSINPTEIDQAKGFREKLLKKKYPKLDEWKEKLSDPKLKEQLQALKQLESLETVLDNPSFKNSKKELAKLEKKHGIQSEEELEKKRPQFSEREYLEMKQMYNFQKEHERLLVQKKGLETKAKDAHKYKKMAEQLEAAEGMSTKSLLSNPRNLRQGLKSFGLNTGWSKLFSGIQSLGIGTSYPFYSQQTLNGTSVNGVHLELNPGRWLYLAGTYGKSARATFDTTRFVPTYTFSQQLFGLRAGVGPRDGTHLHLTYLEIQDQETTPFVDSIRGVSFYPGENYVVGTEFGLRLFDRKLSLGGEINGSVFNRQRDAGEVQINTLEENNIPFKSFINDRLNSSSAVDYAYRGHMDLNLFQGKTKVSGFVSRVGPGYTSLGTPFLLKDLFRWRGEIRQSMFKSRLQLSAFARRDENQLAPRSTLNRSEVTSFGGQMRIQTPAGAYLILIYAPYQQNNYNEINQESLELSSNMMNGIVGYNYALGDKANGLTQIGYLQQNFETDIVGGSYDNKMYTVVQSVNFNQLFSINFNGSYQPEFRIGNNVQKILTYDVSGNAVFFKKWNNTFGYQFLEQNGLDQRTGFYWKSSVPVTSFADLQICVRRNLYDELQEVYNYQETVAFATLNLRW